MSRRLLVRDRAKQDVRDIANFIAADDPDAALRFVDAAENAFTLLLRNPDAGMAREFASVELREVRTWPIRSFDKILIFYRGIGEGIEIIRVLHRARDIPAVFSEESGGSK